MYFLHIAVFWICVAIGIIVFVTLIYALIMRHKSHDLPSAPFHKRISLELFWAIIPFIILIIIAMPAAKVLMSQIT